jgi:hypothetical protein
MSHFDSGTKAARSFTVPLAKGAPIMDSETIGFLVFIAMLAIILIAGKISD